MRKVAIGTSSNSKAIEGNSNFKFNVILANTKSCLNVLNVDDDLYFLEVSKEILELKGNFRVDIATSVDEALKKMESQCYDVVVSDYKMPGKNGLDFLRKMCQLGYTTPFILFTGKGTEEIASLAYNLGAFRYVNKYGNPVAVYGELGKSILEAVEQAQSEEKFAANEELLRQLFWYMPIGVAVYESMDNGEDFLLKYLNTAAENLEKTRANILGKCFNEFPSLKDMGLFEVFQRVWRTEQTEYCQTEMSKDDNGYGRWREYWVYKLPRGNIVVVFNIKENKSGDMKKTKNIAKKAAKVVKAEPLHLLINDILS